MGLVKTAVFPVAGLGTRFLPLTKSTPKEMLPIVTKPLIQYAVEEAIQAGIDHLIFVTSNSKKAIEEYFDKNYELEDRLQKNGNTKALQQVQNIIPRSVSVSYVRQEEPKGLGDAVLKAKRLVGNENFAVLLADDLIASEESSSLLSLAFKPSTMPISTASSVGPEKSRKCPINGSAGMTSFSIVLIGSLTANSGVPSKSFSSSKGI